MRLPSTSITVSCTLRVCRACAGRQPRHSAVHRAAALHHCGRPGCPSTLKHPIKHWLTCSFSRLLLCCDVRPASLVTLTVQGLPACHLKCTGRCARARSLAAVSSEQWSSRKFAHFVKHAGRMLQWVRPRRGIHFLKVGSRRKPPRKRGPQPCRGAAHKRPQRHQTPVACSARVSGEQHRLLMSRRLEQGAKGARSVACCIWRQ